MKIKFRRGATSCRIIGALCVSLFIMGGSSLFAAVKDVEDVAGRIAPWLKGKVVAEEVKNSSGKEFYEISTVDGKLMIKANSTPAAGMALNHYLKHYCKRQFALMGSNLAPVEKMPMIEETIRVECPVRYRHIFNFCTQNYSLSFWGWNDWERMIDYMVLNGINLTISTVGLEQVWYNTLKKFNFTEKEIMEFIPGPAFNAWHMMGNHEGWGGPISHEIMDERVKLQQKILERLRSYDIEPIFISFYGMVPNKLKEKYPEAKIMDQGNWVGGFKRPAVLVPDDPLYEKMADVFYGEVEKLYGKFNYFAGEPFHEGGNREGISASDLAVNVLKTMRKRNPDIVWVLQGWSGNPTTEFLSKLDKEKDVLVWDFRGELYAEWEQRKGYEGYPYMWGVINNFGETPGLYGRLERFNQEYFRAMKGPYGKNMKGLSTAPEGVLNNPVNFDLLYDIAWKSEPIDVPAWIDEYAEYRYGQKSEAMNRVWDVLLQTAYSSNADESLRDPESKSLPSIVGNGESVLCAPPSMNIRSASAWGSSQLFYDDKKMKALIPDLIKAADELKGTDAFEYDLVDITRQLISNEFRSTYYDMVKAIKAKNKEGFEKTSAQLIVLLNDMEALLGTRPEFMVGPWIESAKRCGTTPADKKLMEWNARAQITYWGGEHAGTDLRDYAHKEWAGLMKDVHLPRWQAFIDQQRALLNGAEPKPFNNTAFEMEWAHKNNEYPVKPQGDLIPVAQRILKDLEGMK